MRLSLFGLAAAAALTLSAPALSQAVVVPDEAPARVAPPIRAVPLERQPAIGRCQELRQACLHKDELGEQGQGNCSWYRENCG